MEELAIPKISVCAWYNCKGKGRIAKFCKGRGHIAKFYGGRGGTETYLNDANGINKEPFYCTILKIAVAGHENIRKSFHNRFVCLI